ncbi:hypothetical protein I79_012813 [Cricetulus griseus]|uniref:Uncharacterized protein n=1 Tax=Cricetulus griseus TaxID=10029 RepID=G3HPU3_CRIGR|nr:hypothetical protein I79_012813 [Cricetulus griseus]
MKNGKGLQIQNQTSWTTYTQGRILVHLGTCYIDKIVRRLSETKQPSSWHSGGSEVGRHCRFQALCKEGRVQAAWPPDPE